MELTIRGRTMGDAASDLVCKVTVWPGYARIRIDDRENIGAWVEVDLSCDQLTDPERN